MTIKLSDHFGYKRLLRFTLPSIIMMIFSSIYGVVDGLFVSNIVGKTAFAAVNFIMPVLMILGAVGFMFGAGGSALVSKLLGEGDKPRAMRVFTLLVIVSAAIGAVIAVPSFIFLRPIASLLGAEGQMLQDAVLYGRIILAALPFFVLQYEFQSFFITAEKPGVGLAVTVVSGVSNIVLDALLVGIAGWGLVGAALATAVSQAAGGIIPLLYFSLKKDCLLHFARPSLDLGAIMRTCANGSSELMSNVSMSLVGMLYNIQLLKYAGEDGISAYGVLMYVNMIFLAVFIGYSVGTAPVVGYHYGAGNRDELKSLRKKSLNIILVSSLAMLGLSFLLARPLSFLFVGYDGGLMDMTVRGFYIYSFSFLFAGVAIYGSSFFTALNNGLISAVISFLRTLVFQCAAVLILPLIWELDGIWISIVAAEVAAVAITVIFLASNRKKYGY